MFIVITTQDPEIAYRRFDGGLPRIYDDGQTSTASILARNVSMFEECAIPNQDDSLLIPAVRVPLTCGAHRFALYDTEASFRSRLQAALGGAALQFHPLAVTDRAPARPNPHFTAPQPPTTPHPHPTTSSTDAAGQISESLPSTSDTKPPNGQLIVEGVNAAAPTQPPAAAGQRKPKGG